MGSVSRGCVSELQEQLIPWSSQRPPPERTSGPRGSPRETPFGISLVLLQPCSCGGESERSKLVLLVKLATGRD